MCRVLNQAASISLDELFPIAVCRDERCTIVDVHPPHSITDTKAVMRARLATFGWIRDPFEQQRPIPPPQRSPWDVDRRFARTSKSDALDEIILDVLSRYTIKPVRIIHNDVIDSYGSCQIRRLHRHLATLVELGAVIHLEFGSDKFGCFRGQLSGYTKPGSSLIRDPEQAREILWRQMEAA